MIEGPPVALFRTHSLELRDEARGLDHRLFVAVPDEPAPAGGFPTLYLLDGGAYFGTLVEMVRLRRNRPAMTGVEASVVVGLAHPGAHPWDRARRAREYTPEPEGAAGDFRAFLRDVVHPFIEARTPADPARRVLIGHSLAGAFTLHAWLHEPARYDRVLAISPSIWAFRAELFGALVGGGGAQRVAAAPTSRAMVMVGEYDQTLAPWQRGSADPRALERRRAERRMVDDARDWCSELNARTPHPAAAFHELPGEDHASVLPVALSRALRLLIGTRPD